MKRILIRLAVLTVFVALGTIAIAQAQRGSNTTPTSEEQPAPPRVVRAQDATPGPAAQRPDPFGRSTAKAAPAPGGAAAASRYADRINGAVTRASENTGSAVDNARDRYQRFSGRLADTVRSGAEQASQVAGGVQAVGAESEQRFSRENLLRGGAADDNGNLPQRTSSQAVTGRDPLGREPAPLSDGRIGAAGASAAGLGRYTDRTAPDPITAARDSQPAPLGAAPHEFSRPPTAAAGVPPHEFNAFSPDGREAELPAAPAASSRVASTRASYSAGASGLGDAGLRGGAASPGTGLPGAKLLEGRQSPAVDIHKVSAQGSANRQTRHV